MPTAVSATPINRTTVQYTNDDGSTTTLQGGTRAWRTNNPGNMIYGNLAQSYGAIGEDAYGMAIFPNYTTGRQGELSG
jgi:hypothetical protein